MPHPNYCPSPDRFIPYSLGVDGIAHQTNVTYATEFVKCICIGTGEGGVLGQEKMLDSVGICAGCASTPELIKSDLTVCPYPFSSLPFPYYPLLPFPR